MADSTLATESDAFAYLATDQVPTLVTQLTTIQRLCQEQAVGRGGVASVQSRGWIDARNAAAKILDALLSALNSAAVEYTGLSEAAIIERIHATQSANRPQQHIMESFIHSEPGPFGTVKIALLDWLDRIRNPNGYGTFWQAQEYGTDADGFYGAVPEQSGRVLFGIFEPSHTAPDAQQAGEGAGHDLAFFTDYNDPDAGFGTINVELRGRHFLRDGSSTTGAKYLDTMEQLQETTTEALRKLAAAIAALLAADSGITIRAILDA